MSTFSQTHRYPEHVLQPESCVIRTFSGCASVAIALLFLFGVGCGRPDGGQTTSTGTDGSVSPTSTTCPEPHGPLTREIVRCRLLRASAAGAYPRRLSPNDADAVLDAADRISAAIAARQSHTMNDSQFSSVTQEADTECRTLTGMSCINLLLMPVSR